MSNSPFRPSALMAAVRGMNKSLGKVDSIIFKSGNSLEYWQPCDPEALDCKAISEHLNEAENQRNMIEAIALDYADTFQTSLKNLLIELLEIFPNYGWDWDSQKLSDSEEFLVIINRNEDSNIPRLLEYAISKARAILEKIDLAIVSIYLLNKEPSKTVEWFVDCDEPAQFRFHPYLREASKDLPIPREITMRQGLRDQLQKYVDGLNAFMKRHSDKPFKFSGKGGALWVVPKKPSKN